MSGITRCGGITRLSPTSHLVTAFESVPELVGAVVGADRQVIFPEDMCDFGIKIVR